MELRSQRTRRSVQAPGMERHERAAPQPAVSRSAHAARAASRRLHRLGERCADGAGLPAGGARRAARNRVAGDAGLRPHRHPRHQPRLVPRAADDGTRTADQGGGAEPHLAVLCRRRLARHFDASRARGDGREHRPRSAARAMAADQPAMVSRAHPRSAHAARVCAIRPHVPGRSLGGSRPGVSRSGRAARSRRAALRALQHGQDAFQIRRWVDIDAILTTESD